MERELGKTPENLINRYDMHFSSITHSLEEFKVNLESNLNALEEIMRTEQPDEQISNELFTKLGDLKVRVENQAELIGQMQSKLA
jgi:chaperone required for assembly of F1-ATPase